MNTNIKSNYSHLIGQAVKGFRKSKILSINEDHEITFEYEVLPGVIKQDTRDLAQVEVLTIGG